MRWGVLGTGKIAHDFVTALFASDSEHVVAVASRTLARAEEFARSHNIPVGYGSHEDLLDDPQVDIVYIATASAEHVPTGLLCVAHNKHVLVEKPMALTARGARALCAAAAEKSLFLMEGVWMYFFPVIQQVSRLIVAGEIGEPISLQASFGWNNPTDLNPAVEDATQGGGALGAVGIYLVHLALIVFGGLPTKVVAIGEKGPLGADTHTSILLGFAGSKHAVLSCSLRANLDGGAMIHGTKGSVRIPFPFICPLKAEICADGAPVVHVAEQLPQSPEVCDDTGNVISGKYNLIHSAGLVYEAEAVAATIGAGALQSELVPLDRSLVALDILDTIREQIGLSYNDCTDIRK